LQSLWCDETPDDDPPQSLPNAVTALMDERAPAAPGRTLTTARFSSFYA